MYLVRIRKFNLKISHVIILKNAKKKPHLNGVFTVDEKGKELRLGSNRTLYLEVTSDSEIGSRMSELDSESDL